MENNDFLEGLANVSGSMAMNGKEIKVIYLEDFVKRNEVSSYSKTREYFENSENREIFTIWQQTSDLSSLKDGFDSALWEYIYTLTSRDLPSNQIEQKYADCVLRLRERFLRNLEIKKGEALALEAETGGTAAELSKLKEQGIEVSVQLGEVFSQRAGEPGTVEVINGRRK